ncbi:unnamed protein product [Symbiodinium sp. CCMP2592]|nr:unnamed protein product [Symbiodinium sp. CCMP2592]
MGEAHEGAERESRQPSTFATCPTKLCHQGHWQRWRSRATRASVKCLDQSEEKVLDLRVTAPCSRASEAPLWQQFRSSWPHKKQESEASKGSIAAHETDSVIEKAAIDPFHPSFEALPVLLQHLAVRDMLYWRVTSRQTRSPEVLTRHVAELGRFDTPASMVAYFDAVEQLEGPPRRSTSEAFADDVGFQKRFECQYWCITLARATTTHFGESVVREIVIENLESLIGHCLHTDQSVREAAHYVVANHAFGGLGFVKERIAKAVLSQMRDILSTSEEEISVTWVRMFFCMQHLKTLLRSLTKPQRQAWASMLATILHRLQTPSAPQLSWAASHKQVVEDLKLLWLADDDPNGAYADTKRRLEVLMKSPNFEGVRQDLHSLFMC